MKWIQIDDLIKEVNRREIQNLEEYTHAIRKIKKSEDLLLLIKRQDGTFYVVVESASEK